MAGSDLRMIQKSPQQEEWQRARRSHDHGRTNKEKKKKNQRQATRSKIRSAKQAKNNDHVADIYSDYDLYQASKCGSLDDFVAVLDRASAAERRTVDEILQTVSPAGNMFIHIAAKHGNEDIVAYIANENPSLVLKKNSNGETALHLAAKAGHESMVKALVQIHHDLQHSNFDPTAESSEADENNLLRAKSERGNTALHEALIYGWDSIAQYLIQNDPEGSYIQNKKGESAYYLAAKAGFANCFQGCHMNAKFKENFPIRAAMEGKSRAEVFKWMLEYPSLMQSRDVERKTPLHHAASLGFLEGVHDLLNQAVPSAYERDESGSLPIHLGSKGGHVDIVSLLLQHSYDPEELLDYNGRNILHVAVV